MMRNKVCNILEHRLAGHFQSKDKSSQPKQAESFQLEFAQTSMTCINVMQTHFRLNTKIQMIGKGYNAKWIADWGFTHSQSIADTYGNGNWCFTFW
jgi:hypothetical protein